MQFTYSILMFGICSGLLFIFLTLNGFLITIRPPPKTVLLPMRVHPTVIPITSATSNHFLYSDERKKLYPDYERERSYQRYFSRLRQSLLSYSIQEKQCFEETKADCLSYNRVESKYATKKYKEKDLHLQVPDEVKVLVDGKYCDNAEIVVGIVTAPFQFAERFAIRNSWCKESRHGIKGVRCYFYSGLTSNSNDNAFLQQEALIYNDIVQFDIADTYLNLTILQLQSFNWTLSHCRSMKYYVRTDADMFVNLKTVVNRIIPSLPSSFAYGHVFRGAKPFRDPHHKYYLPRSVYPQQFFPPYISGCMCILSRDVLQTLVEGSETVRPIHYLDDAYYGQIMDRYGVLIVDDRKFISVNQLPLKEVLKGNYAAVHRFSPVDLIVIDSFQQGK